VLIAAGGTGGHVFPALALADELMRRGHSVAWLGRPDSLESRVAAGHGHEFEPVPAAGLFGKRMSYKLRWPWITLRGAARACRVLRRRRPDALVAAGGFVSAPALFCARAAGLPYFLLEQNRVPGRVTRLFAGSAKVCFLTFPLVEPIRAACSVTGSPLRPALAAGGRSDDGRTVLVLGGSGGARVLNFAAIESARALPEYHFVVLTGRRDHKLIRSQDVPANCELVEFTEAPEELYRRATLAVSRAGGMVLSELVVFGIPAILIPFPHATDNHQDANARHLESVGAAIVLDQDRLPGLTAMIDELMSGAERRREMSDAAGAVGRPDAAADIVERIERCLAA